MLIRVGEIVAPHGIRGAVKVRTFIENPDDLIAYGPLVDKGGQKVFELKQIGSLKEAIICEIKGITTRNDAETLRGISLYINRDQLPALEDGFYQIDLIGYEIKTITGEVIGKVKGFENYGSADLLDVALPNGDSCYLPYIDTVIKHIDETRQVVIIDPIPGLLEAIKEEKND